MQRGTAQSLRYILLLTLVVILSFWKLIFTKQFTILAQWEIVNQAYTWYSYAARSIQHGIVPLWDPYRFAGNTFIGEMQTGLFYPFKLALYLSRLDSNGLLSERAFNDFFVFSHWLAAIWMFALARYLKLSRLASLVSAICFGLGGFMRVAVWPNIVDAMAWLPFVMLFSLRAFDGERARDRLFNACVAGVGLGMTVLAGSIHVAIMNAIVVASLAIYVGLDRNRKKAVLPLIALVLVIGTAAAAVGAVQLLPSMEYAPLSYRWYGGTSPIVSNEKIPYPVIAHATNFSAKSVFALLLGEVDAGDSAFSSYYGVLPLLLVIIGAWKYWRLPLTRYLIALAAISFLYTWGGFSFIHGVLYLAPILDMARESDRFIYLTQFAMAVLAGFGMQALFEDRTTNSTLSLKPLLTILKWVVIVFAALLSAASLGLPLAVTDFTYLSFFFIASSFVVLLLCERSSLSTVVQVLMVFLIVWDFYSFAPLDSKMALAAGNHDYYAQLLYDRKLADFFHSQSDMPRVHFDATESPNLGHAFGVPLTWGMSATALVDYTHYLGNPRRNELFDVGYTVLRKENDKGSNGSPVYSDDVWNVYKNPEPSSRAWIVHGAEIDNPNNRTLDLQRTTADSVQWLLYDANSLEVETRSAGPGLLVLSEVFYPGWKCTVDGMPAPIYRADGILRSVPIGGGTHRVSMRYRPASVMWGAASTILSLLGMLCWSLLRCSGGL